MNVKEFVKKNLLSFTGLDAGTLNKYIDRKQYPEFKKEWLFWKPDSDANIRLFYMLSRAYLFGNATHKLHDNILKDISNGKTVLDFGGGSGNYSYEVENAGNSVDHFDINFAQREFVKYTASKNSLDINVLNWDDKFMPIINRKYDAILALDVVEHIPNYPDYVKVFSQNMNVGGKIYIYAPFGTSSDPTHIDDKHGLASVMKNNRFNRMDNIIIGGGAKCMVFKRV